MIKGQIIQSLSGYYDILTADKKVYRTRARGNFRAKKQAPLVGDYVDFKAQTPDEGYLLKIYPRKNQLIRPPVANVDSALVVSACVQPNFSSNLLDRQLIMLAVNGIEPILCFSKADLLDEQQEKQMIKLIDYYAQFYACCMTTEANLCQLEALLAQRQQQVMVVMGQTGAGKSTLLNKIKPDLQLETGEISKALSRGKHTTRKVTLMEIGANLIADTPGFSSFDILDVAKEDLPNYYPDFLEYRDHCKFRGCLHLNEPKCAVKQAVADGQILASRYENYLMFLETIMNAKPRYK